MCNMCLMEFYVVPVLLMFVKKFIPFQIKRLQVFADFQLPILQKIIKVFNLKRNKFCSEHRKLKSVDRCRFSDKNQQTRTVLLETNWLVIHVNNANCQFCKRQKYEGFKFEKKQILWWTPETEIGRSMPI